MVKTYTVTDLQRVAVQKLPPPPCDTTMQVIVHTARDGVAHGSWRVERSYGNGLGVAKGGFSSSTPDIVIAYAVASQLTDHQGFASLNLDTTFHRAVVDGDVYISAMVKRMGRTLAYVTAELKQSNKKVATRT